MFNLNNSTFDRTNITVKRALRKTLVAIKLDQCIVYIKSGGVNLPPPVEIYFRYQSPEILLVRVFGAIGGPVARWHVDATIRSRSIMRLKIDMMRRAIQHAAIASMCAEPRGVPN